MSRWGKYRNAENEQITIEVPSIDFGKGDDKEPLIQSPTNKLYFYSDTTRDSIHVLNRQLDELTRQLRILQINYNLCEPPPIHLHISSEGGEVFAALAAVDKIVNNPVPIHTYCEGVVASAATLLSVVGKKRFICKNSSMLVHQISSGMWGNYQQFKDEVQNLDLLMRTLKGIYCKYTKIKETDLEEMMKHDLYIEPQMCLELGLVNEII